MMDDDDGGLVVGVVLHFESWNSSSSSSSSNSNSNSSNSSSRTNSTSPLC